MKTKAKKKRDVNLAIPPATWRKVGELIMTWAQDDGTSDDLMELVAASDYGPPDGFWDEFRRRLSPFLEPDAKPFVEQVFVVQYGAKSGFVVCANAGAALDLMVGDSEDMEQINAIRAWDPDDGADDWTIGSFAVHRATVQL